MNCQLPNSNYILVDGLEHFLFFHILGRIIPNDFHIFQRGRYTTNQFMSLIANLVKKKSPCFGCCCEFFVYYNIWRKNIEAIGCLSGVFIYIYIKRRMIWQVAILTKERQVFWIWTYVGNHLNEIITSDWRYWSFRTPIFSGYHQQIVELSPTEFFWVLCFMAQSLLQQRKPPAWREQFRGCMVKKNGVIQVIIH